jgi:hypothetical protein
MVRHMVRVAVVLVVAVAVLSGCTEATVDPSPVPPTGTASSTSPAAAVPRALSVPVPVEGEVTRAVVSGAEGGGSQKRTVAATPIKGRTYVVKSACAADATTTTVSYRLLDARPDSGSQSTAERLVMAASVVCDGVPRVDSAGPLSFPVLVQYDAVPSAVASAYAVVVPE